jgi:hypothetical protein
MRILSGPLRGAADLVEVGAGAEAEAEAEEEEEVAFVDLGVTEEEVVEGAAMLGDADCEEGGEDPIPAMPSKALMNISS